MKYLLLTDMTGVIRDRTPEMSGTVLYFEFEGAPEGAMAVFKTNRGEIYRALEGGCCTIDANGLVGEIGVTVALFDGTAEAQRWVCDGVLLYPLVGGNMLLVPSDGNLSQTVAIMRIRMDAADAECERLRLELEALREEYHNLMNGYPVV